jgi:hypothetical protein
MPDFTDSSRTRLLLESPSEDVEMNLKGAILIHAGRHGVDHLRCGGFTSVAGCAI